jgi:hypothetical protein
MFQDSCTTEDWRTLQFGPFWVSIVVAGADRKLDEKEAAVLAGKLAQVASGERRYDDPLVQELFGSIAQDPGTVMREFNADQRGLLDGISDLADVLKRRIGEEQAQHLKVELLNLGMETAQASPSKPKGVFGRFRKSVGVSDEEKVAMVAIVAALEGELDTLRAAMS